jgi:hypothetical protein
MIEISGAGSVPRTSVSESATLVRPMHVVYHPTGTVYVYKKNLRCGRASEAQQNLLCAHTAESRTTRYSCRLPARIFQPRKLYGTN